MSKDNKNTAQKQSPMMKVAAFIVDKRMLFFLLYVIALIFSLFSSRWVSVENDLAEYLSETTETKQGLTLMKDQFITFGSAKVMVANITFDDATDLAEKIRKMDGVSAVTFTEPEEEQSEFVKHYANGSALFNVTFSYAEEDERALESLENLKEELSGYDLYISTDLGNQTAEIIEAEIRKIMVLVAFVVVTVLLITSESYAEIPVLSLTFVVSMLLNNGTNFLFGTISFVSNSVSSILQLALSVDYAIILCNRYKEENAGGLSVRDAVTISGLFALVFMQYKIGADMGIVLIKAILLSLLSVFTLMPGLLMIFAALMDRTRHKSFVPKIGAVGKFSYATRHVVPLLFMAVFAAAWWFSKNCPYVYGYSTLSTPVLNETQIADNMITDNFGDVNFVAVVVPGHDYRKEHNLIRDLENRSEVRYCQGLANTEAMGGYMLTDSVTPREFSELMNVDYELAEVLYSAYAADQEQFGRVIGGVESYGIPLMDLVQFVYELTDEGYITLAPDLTETLESANTQIADGRKQLEGSDYDRILVYLSLPEESDETFAFLDEIHSIASRRYDDEPVYVVGNSTSQRDLRSSFERDNLIVSIVSVLFVLVILLFTFQSAGMPVLLIVVIEGAIFMNFSFPTIMHQNLFFMGYLIVSSIQMGANIDYAIVISSRYMDLRKTRDRKAAVSEALDFAFPTIITSGSMMTLAGVFIGRMTSDPCIAGIGECLGRGTLISIVLVMLVLPQILIVGDRIIAKTAFDIETPVHTREESGTLLIDGMVRGTINGTVIGTVHAVVRGEANVILVSGSMERQEDDGTPALIEAGTETEEGAEEIELGRS